jgi:dephospho-CoA kinase
MFIIGITGTIGAGKGTVVEYLVGQKGFDHYSVRSFLIDRFAQVKMNEQKNGQILSALPSILLLFLYLHHLCLLFK